MVSCNFPKKESSKIVSATIIGTIKEKANLLDRRKAFHISNYGAINNILLSDIIGLTKLKGAVVTLDTCLPARATSRMTVDVVKNATKEQEQL